MQKGSGSGGKAGYDRKTGYYHKCVGFYHLGLGFPHRGLLSTGYDRRTEFYRIIVGSLTKQDFYHVVGGHDQMVNSLRKRDLYRICVGFYHRVHTVQKGLGSGGKAGMTAKQDIFVNVWDFTT